MTDPNRQLLVSAAELLRPLLDGLVFVGGCATGVLVTDPGSGGIRPTIDVDTIVEVKSYAEYAALSGKLRDLGLTEDSTGDVICRWRKGDLLIDVMPTEERILAISRQGVEERARPQEPAHLVGDVYSATQARLPLLLDRLRALADRSSGSA